MSSALLMNEPPLMVQPTLALTVGLNEALFLQQVHYWLNPRLNKNYANERHWVYNTCDQWKKQFPFWGEKTIRRTIANLEKMKVLISYSGMINNRKTKFYSIDYDTLDFLTDKNTLSASSGQNDQINLPVWANPINSDSYKGIFLSSEDKNSAHPDGNKSFTENLSYGNLHLPEVTDSFLSQVSSPPSGQNDHINLPKRANVENLRSSDMPKSKNGRNSAYGQNDQIDVVNLTRSYNKDTETTSENTLLPPPLSSSSNASVKEEKEDDDMDFLISVWNGIVQSKLETSAVFLTTKRRITLKSVFTHYFGSDKASWKAYCEKIARTKFLMGQNDNGFKAGFDWSINPDNIVRIQEGAFYDKPIPEKETSEPSWEEFENALRERQTDKAYPFSWTNVCLSLARQTNQHVSTALFEKIHPENLSDSVARLIVPFQFIFDQIRDRHLQKLKAAIRAEYPHVSDVSLEVERC